MDYVKRLKNLLAATAQAGVDAYFVSKGSDIKYLTGFTGEYGTSVLVVSSKGCHFVTDGRYESQAGTELGDLAEVHIYKRVGNKPANYFTCAGDVMADLGVASASYVASDLTVADFMDLKEHAGSVELKAGDDLVAPLRMIKDAEEIAIVREADKINMRSFYGLLDHIKPGMTEIDVANEMEYQFRSRGGSGFCFETIVASGPDNGACPHATASDRVLEAGDFVTIDFGTYYKGYCSDITRTVVLGKAKEPKLYDIWNIVEEAKQLGMSMVKPGVTYAEISNAINKYVNDRGYTIPHGVGHNYGLDIHEPNFMGPNNFSPEVAGMVHTIEPGIYIPGLGGVRQEDDVLVTEDGYERLSYITDHLIEL
ncbi:MAG: M24 family metallopeptidase [Atopobiaceae bacterium]|jgi:Xaa-Pro aminopeptidase